MPLIRCIEGHIFDNAAHAVCPICGAAVTNLKPEPLPDPKPQPQPKLLPKREQITAENVTDHADPKPKRPLWLYAAGGGGLLVIALILFFVLRPSTPPIVPLLSGNNTAQTQTPTPQPAPAHTPAPATATATPPQAANNSSPPVPAPAPAPQAANNSPATAPPPSPTPAPAPAPLSPPGVVTGPAMFTGSTGMLDIAGNQVKLIGVIGDPTEVQAASEFLHYATNGTFAVQCVLQQGGDYDCRTVATNVRVSAGLVANGFATADPSGPAEYQQWQADAQAHHRGLWATP